MQDLLPVQICFQGGGAKIALHLAAVHSLREANGTIINITRVAGTSAGAIAALCLAADIDPSLAAKQIAHRSEKLVFSAFSARRLLKNRRTEVKNSLRLDGLSVSSQRPSGLFYRFLDWLYRAHVISHIVFSKSLVQKNALENLIADILYTREDFKDIPASDLLLSRVCNFDIKIPAIDTSTNRERVFDKSAQEFSAPQIVASSCRVPGLLGAPSQHGKIPAGHFYDGGFTTNLPVEHLYDDIERFGPILAIGFPVRPTDNPSSPNSNWDLAKALVNTAINNVVERTRRESKYSVHLLNLQSDLIASSADFGASQVLLEDFDEALGTEKETVTNEIRELLIPARREFHNTHSHFLQARAQFGVPNERAQQFQHILVGYPNESFLPFQREVLGVVEDVFGITTRRLPENRGSFEVSLRPNLALARPWLYPFPFLLTWTRRSTWGVIPYARHKRLALAWDVTALSEHLSQELEDLQDVTTGNNNWNLGTVISRFAEAYSRGDNISKRLRIWCSPGFIGNELVPEVIAGSPEASRLSQLAFVQNNRLFPDTLSASKSSPIITSQREEYHSYPQPQIPLNRFRRNTDICLIDLAVAADFCREFDLSSTPIPHGLDIPAGIGFSVVYGDSFLGPEPLESRNRWVTATDMVNNYLNNNHALKDSLILSGFDFVH